MGQKEKWGIIRISIEAVNCCFKAGGIIVKNTIEYKGYVGSVEFSEADAVFFGKVMGIRTLISYEGSNAQELLEDFHGAVDEYLEVCQAEGIEPEKAYKGSFNVRLSAEIHKQAAVYAMEHGISLNNLVEKAVQSLLIREQSLA